MVACDLVWAGNTVNVRPVFGDRFGTGNKTSTIGLAGEKSERVHRRGLVQNQDGAILIFFSDQLHDFSAWRWKIGIPNVQSMPQFREIAQYARNGRTIRAKVR